MITHGNESGKNIRCDGTRAHSEANSSPSITHFLRLNNGIGKFS
jgi:hypothetical protein